MYLFSAALLSSTAQNTLNSYYTFWSKILLTYHILRIHFRSSLHIHRNISLQFSKVIRSTPINFQPFFNKQKIVPLYYSHFHQFTLKYLCIPYAPIFQYKTLTALYVIYNCILFLIDTHYTSSWG